MPKLRPNQFTLPSGAVITEHPILFQTEMVKANLEDRKTQTRRTRGFTNENPNDWELCHVGDTTINERKDKVFGVLAQHKTYLNQVVFVKSPYGKPGDLLWVKETWANLNGNLQKADPFLIFKADIQHSNQHGPVTWKPSIHLPKAASRIWAMVEEIRVERVQDICEEDALNEGVIEYDDFTFKNYFTKKGLRAEDGVEIVLAKGSFQSLWISINGFDSWDANPWVWVIKYRILSKTGRPSMEVIEKNYFEVKGKEVSNV